MDQRGKILVAGATGNVGGKIVDALLKLGADVRATVRPNADGQKVQSLRAKGVNVIPLNMNDGDDVARACEGIDCVVSALAGLRDVIIDTQKVLVDAAIQTKVKRFIPSDYSLDFTNLIEGRNRNLDLRREFHQYLKDLPIQVTTIFNGAFMDLLAGNMPVIQDKFNRILYWGDADQPMDFTTTFDAAAYTARAAVDSNAPRYLHIVGDQVTSRHLKQIASEVTGKEFKLLKAGSVGFLNGMIVLMKVLKPGSNQLYPPWQGMQYMRDMIEGRVVVDHYDNNRYGAFHWTSVKEFLSDEVRQRSQGDQVRVYSGTGV